MGLPSPFAAAAPPAVSLPPAAACAKTPAVDAPESSTALESPEPETLAELMSYVFGVAWFRSHLPRFAEVAAPLYDLWKDALAPFKRKSKQSLIR